jgi:hypothetical protein
MDLGLVALIFAAIGGFLIGFTIRGAIDRAELET